MPIPEADFSNLPINALQGLQGNPPAEYSEWQRAMLPYLDMYQGFLWICFWGVLAVVCVRFIALPLWRRPRLVLEAGPRRKQLPSSAGLLKKAEFYYRRIFSIDEIDGDIAVRIFGGAILLGYVAAFQYWMKDPAGTVDALQNGTHICWPFFQNCEILLWSKAFPYGYAQTVFYMGLFGLIMLASYGLLARRAVLAHMCILILFVCKIILMLQTISFKGNYEYYHNLFSIVFLFLPYKRFFGSLSVVFFYFLSTESKIHPSWTWGAYFSNLREGLPIFGKGTEILWANLIIFMEMFMSWFLFSRRVWLQRSVFVFFCLFHLYSGALVGYHYPLVVMPPLLIFFGPLYKPFTAAPLGPRSLPGWILLAVILSSQMLRLTMPGDVKLTLEGHLFGLNMFDANHQCRTVYTNDTGVVLRTFDSTNAFARCDPYDSMAMGQLMFCRAPAMPKIGFTEIHSINGGPFYEIVNENDLCGLHYSSYTHNNWIKNEETAPMVGRPLQNYYR